MITLNRKVRFSHPDFTYTGNNYTEFLFGSIGLKVNAEIRVEVAWSTQSVNLKYLTTDDSIERLDGGLASFITDGFKIGDSITVTGTVSNNATYTVSKVTDAFIFVTGNLVNETVVSNIFGVTPITDIDFYPNLIENTTDFSLGNLTDRETIPLYHADNITTDAANPTKMAIGTNSQGWVTPADSATIYRLSFNNYIQIFVISHTFNIAPIFIANQLSNLKKRLPPAAGVYQDRSCLKYVYTIDGKFSSYDPDIPHTTDGNVVFPKGQTGWFNEFINGRPTQWTKESLLYTNATTGAGLTAIEYCAITNVQARLVCQVAAGISYIVQVMYLPQNEEEYVNTSTNFKTNFIYERAVVTIGAGTVQGENTGDYHFLLDVVATAITANRTQIDFKIDFSQTLTTLFDTKDSDNLNYLIFITAQNGTGGVP